MVNNKMALTGEAVIAIKKPYSLILGFELGSSLSVAVCQCLYPND